MKRIVSGIVVALLLVSMLTFAFNIKPVKSEWTGTVYIRADGSIDPPDAPVMRNGDIYTLTASIGGSIVIERHNIVVDGRGYTVVAPVNERGLLNGIILSRRSNVTVANMKIWYFFSGIYLYSSENIRIIGNSISYNEYGIDIRDSSLNSISGNKIANNNKDGVYLATSSHNTITGNSIRDNYEGIYLYTSCNNNSIIGNNITASKYIAIGFYSSSNNNSIIGNNIANNDCGISIYTSSYNSIIGNNITATNYHGIRLYSSSNNNSIIGNDIANNNGEGIYLESSCNKNSIIKNNITANTGYGVYLTSSSHNTITGNSITNNNCGVYLTSSSYNSIIGNNITASIYDGVCLYTSSNNIISGNNIANNKEYGVNPYKSYNNTFYHNNFIDNTYQAYSEDSIDFWDDGYPSGGNYWSDYRTRYPNAAEIDGSGIWNTPYVINAKNNDGYPLMAPFNTFGVGTWNGIPYSVDIVSNSTITNLMFNPTARTLTFNVRGTSGTVGFCRVAIPLSLMWCANPGDWNVTIDGTQVLPSNLKITVDGNYTYVYFTYSHSTKTVNIQSTSAIPEFLSFLILPLFMIATLLAVIVYRRKRISTG